MGVVVRRDVIVTTWAIQSTGSIPPQQTHKRTGFLTHTADTFQFGAIFESFVVVHKRPRSKAPIFVTKEIVGSSFGSKFGCIQTWKVR